MSMSKRIMVVAVSLLLLAVLVAGCRAKQKSDSSNGNISKSEVEKVELLYFHPRIRCLSCNNIEKYAQEVAVKDFSSKMKDGKLKFESLRIEDPANKALVDEFDVGGSSLYIVASGNGKKVHHPIKDVWLYWDKEGKCKEIVRNELSEYL